MAFSDLELSLMAFPQSWDATRQQISVNLLLLPAGNPLAPLGTGPQFAGTAVLLDTVFVADAGTLPSTGSVAAVTKPFMATPPIGAVSLYKTIVTKLGATTVTAAPPKLASAQCSIKKSLPPSYINAFPFEQPADSNVLVGDGYGCALGAQSPGQLYPPQPKPPAITSWGEILSYALRQPQLATALGLIYNVTLPISAATVAKGGWLYFALDTSSPTHPWVKDFQTNSDRVKSYAARIPPLVAGTSRQLFAATLFPIVAAPGSDLAPAQFQAELYDDGFAQIVHCNQPTTVDAATGDTTQIAPGAEAGLQVGWDDEQVTTWMNSQVALLQYRLGGAAAPESPLGVLGYRVDVQAAGTSTWASLCNVSGSLPFSGSTSNGSGATPSGELWVTPAPVRPSEPDWSAPTAPVAWLPLYFTQWRGTSLVVHDDTISNISPGTTTLPANLLSADLAGVPTLRYGEQFNFRVRFVDLTGGGPTAAGAPVHPGLAPAGSCLFRRHLPPKALEISTTPPPLPATTDGSGNVTQPTQPSTRTITKLTVARPNIGYPEAVFAGVSPGTFSGASLTALLTAAKLSGRALSVPDPDVDRFEVIVEARIPAHDTGTPGTEPGDLDGTGFRIVYSVIEHFPASLSGSVTLALNYVETEDISTLTLPADDAATLPIPTARDIRIRLQALSTIRSNYYGTAEPPAGLISDYKTRKEASNETDLFSLLPQEQLTAFYFQPGTNLIQLLAQNIRFPLTGAPLGALGLTLTAPPGERVAFAASGALRQSVSADGGSITFTNQAEFLDHWIVAFTIDIARDWTWDGFAPNALTVTRNGTAIGSLTLPRSVPAIALGSAHAPPNRTSTRLIFFDALQPQPAPGSFPAPLSTQYQVTANFISAPPLVQNYPALILPITTKPSQTPKIVSTGIAETPFVAAPDYSATSLRQRFLWIEFDQPILDPDDTYFGRVLNYGPDPLLAAVLVPPAKPASPPEPALPIDPELIRVIFDTQASDEAGLQAMTPLIAANASGGHPDGVHFLLPLPEGIAPEALDLFGFWTYEFRVGHVQQWSTAQGRFGRPLRVTGIQHPAPHLVCTAHRSQTLLSVSAPYAVTVRDGVRLYNIELGDPQTEIYFMLYAQVLQADGASYRNVLLSHAPGALQPDSGPILLGATPPLVLPPPVATLKPVPPASAPRLQSVNRDPRASTSIKELDIRLLLDKYSLPFTSPLSVLAVELLPGPLTLKRNQAFGASSSNNGSTGTPAASDPLGANLGSRRILRVSNLTAVPAIC